MMILAYKKQVVNEFGKKARELMVKKHLLYMRQRMLQSGAQAGPPGREPFRTQAQESRKYYLLYFFR